MALRVWFWLLSLSVLWDGSFFFAKVAVAELPPLSVVFARVGLAAVVLDLLLAVRGQNLFRRSTPWRSFFAMGILNNLLPFSLIFWGQMQITSGLAAILNATTPLFTVVVAHYLTDVAALAGIAGVALLIGPGVLTQAGSGLWGEIACLGAALSYAFASLYGRRFKAMGVAPITAAAGQVTASAVLILPIMLIVDRPWILPATPSLAVWAPLVGIALLSTALAYVLFFRILAAAGATNLALVTFLIPLTAILLGAAFLDERLDVRDFAGMALIGLGLALIDGRIGHVLRPAK